MASSSSPGRTAGPCAGWAGRGRAGRHRQQPPAPPGVPRPERPSAGPGNSTRFLVANGPQNVGEGVGRPGLRAKKGSTMRFPAAEGAWIAPRTSSVRVRLAPFSSGSPGHFGGDEGFRSAACRFTPAGSRRCAPCPVSTGPSYGAAVRNPPSHRSTRNAVSMCEAATTRPWSLARSSRARRLSAASPASSSRPCPRSGRPS